MPEYSDYIETRPPVADEDVDGDELIAASKDGETVQLTAQQIANLSGGGGAWGSITGTLSDQTDLNTALGLKAPLASPALTGNPTAPTQTPGNSSTRIATTEFVQQSVSNLGGILYLYNNFL